MYSGKAPPKGFKQLCLSARCWGVLVAHSTFEAAARNPSLPKALLPPGNGGSTWTKLCALHTELSTLLWDTVTDPCKQVV